MKIREAATVQARQKHGQGSQLYVHSSSKFNMPSLRRVRLLQNSISKALLGLQGGSTHLLAARVPCQKVALTAQATNFTRSQFAMQNGQQAKLTMCCFLVALLISQWADVCR